MSQVVGLPNNSYKPITNTGWVRARLCRLQKRCTRLAAASDKVYQLLAHGRWFSPRTPASSTTKTGRHDIAENGVKHQKSINQSINRKSRHTWTCFKNENKPLITVATFLLKVKSRHVFNPRRTCYEVHAVLVNCLWKHCFAQIVTPTPTDLSSRCPESQNEAGSLHDYYENLSK